MDISTAILQVCQELGTVSDSQLTSLIAGKVTGYSDEIKVATLNELLASGRIHISEEKGEFFIHYNTQEQADVLKSLGAEDLYILQLIREVGSKGMWNAEIKNKTGIPTAHINKSLKNLEKAGLIKWVKSVQAKNRKVWLLSELEPSTEITGGFLMSNSEFDKELFKLLQHHTRIYLEDNTAGLSEITSHLRSHVNKGLQESNVNEILKSMVALQEIEEVAPGKYRRLVWDVPDPPNVPCLSCPLTRECNPDGVINPSTCEYFTKWLSF